MTKYLYNIRSYVNMSKYTNSQKQAFINQINNGITTIALIAEQPNSPTKTTLYRWISDRYNWNQTKAAYEANNSEEYFYYKRCLSRIHAAYQAYGLTIPLKATTLLGCNSEELYNYIKGRLHTDMNISNHGKGLDKWSFDHIRPIASFDISKPEDALEVFNYRNIEPLWNSIHYKKAKGRRYTYNTMEK